MEINKFKTKIEKGIQCDTNFFFTVIERDKFYRLQE